MGSMFWPVPITFVIYKGSFILAKSVMAAAKLGDFDDPSKWWHWVIFALVFIVLELGGRIITRLSDE